MHPANTQLLEAAGIECCVLANNHALDWGYRIPDAHRRFARALIDRAGVDLVHGHSSHHPRPVEVHNGKLIIFGCGDFLNDYEGIHGHEDFRGDLTLMYFADLEPSTGVLRALTLCPMRIANFRLNRATAADTEWLQRLLNRIGVPFNTGVSAAGDGLLQLNW